MITAKIIADSICPSERRLTTFELTYPRFIHSELMTHRAFSRNAASSRAIPIETMLKRIAENPAHPEFWAANQKGMQAVAEVDDIPGAVKAWNDACLSAVEHSRKLAALGLHKAIANRVTEPFQHMVTVVSATEFANFFHLRYHKDAQQEFQILAKKMYALYCTQEPQFLVVGDWHMPYIRLPEDAGDALMMTQGDEVQAFDLLRCVSVGRCARTSYVNQNGIRDLKDDIALHDRLLSTPESGDPGHWSPFEHVARAERYPDRSGNFIGWTQYRKFFRHENTTELPDLPVED